MAGSYEQINYTLRPAKSIERKMLVEAMRRLSGFDPIDSYRYVGFGSTYFSDFALVHKALNISDMISIERDIAKEERFTFNKPFKCIHIEFGESNEILPNLNWGSKTIIWLDYDGRLDSSVLADIKLACSSLVSGSMLIITVNANPQRFEGIAVSELAERRLKLLVKDVGADRIPGGIDGRNLKGWDQAGVYRRIISNEILQTLNERNGGRSEASNMKYQQLFNFRYADGPKMLTTGGLIFDEGQEKTVEECGFEKLQFIRLSDDPYLIQVPSLTFREIQHLDAQLPTLEPAEITSSAVPQSHIEQYARVYRYYPNFAEADM